LVEEFARQDKQRLYPFELQNFRLGVRFQNAEPQAQRVIVMAMLAWLDQHSLKSYGRQDQNAWQMGWKMREAFLHMLQFKIPFQEPDVIAMLNWSASQSSTSAYVYFSGVPQIIKVVSDFLKINPMSDGLHRAIEGVIQSIEAESMSVEIRRWLLRLKELTGETEVSLPLIAGDPWADTALREIYAMNSRTKTAWAELLIHCAHASGSTQAASANTDILKGLVWLCSKSDDPEIARALAALAILSYKKINGSGSKGRKVGKACFWSLANLPSVEGITQLAGLKLKINDNNAQKLIANALEGAIKQTQP
jgi:hypothetical protein